MLYVHKTQYSCTLAFTFSLSKDVLQEDRSHGSNDIDSIFRIMLPQHYGHWAITANRSGIAGKLAGNGKTRSKYF